MSTAKLPVSYVVSVDVNLAPTAAALRNFGAMLIVGDSDVIPVSERIRSYSTAEEVASDFETTTEEYKAALAFFSQSPKPRLLYIGRWNKQPEESEETGETLAECMSALLEYTSWYGAYVSCDYEVSDALAVSAQIEAATPSRIVAFTSQDTNELVATDQTSLGYQLSQKAYKRSIVMFSTQEVHAAMSVLGRMATVNFQGSNTTITLKFKQCPGVAPEYLTSAQARALKGKHVNAFVAFQNDTNILQEGVTSSGYFIDEIHGLDWLQDQVQTDLWNLLYTSTTKVGQDESGMNAILSTVNKSLNQGVTNHLIAPGVWNADGFGALNRGDTLSTGYYVYIQPLAEQSQSDREARKAPPIQIAVKLAGAVHFVDVIITVNR